METKLHGVINAEGSYRGFSANYSGDGFSGMRFTFHGLSEGDFHAWIARVRADGDRLDRRAYLELERPSEHVPVRHFGDVEPLLWDAIVNMCVEPGKMCMSEMMALDAQGGLGLAGVRNTLPLAYDKYARRGATVLGGPGEGYVLAVCTPQEAEEAALARIRLSEAELLAPPRPIDPLRGAGLPRSAPFSRTPSSFQTASLDAGS
jgi:cytochrome o ubiquinol oxidase subunit 2